MDSAPQKGTISFRLDVVELVEPDVLLFAALGELSLVVRAKAEEADFARDAEIHLEFPTDRLHFFDTQTGARLP